MQNGSVESFNARVRDEFLNEHVFANLFEVRAAAADWLTDFNDVRPHHSLRYQTPADYAATFKMTQPPQLSVALCWGLAHLYPGARDLNDKVILTMQRLYDIVKTIELF